MVAVTICTACGCMYGEYSGDREERFPLLFLPLGGVYTIVLLSFWAACHISDNSKLAAFWVTMVVFAVLFVLYFGMCTKLHLDEFNDGPTAAAIVLLILSVVLMIVASVHVHYGPTPVLVAVGTATGVPNAKAPTSCSACATNQFCAPDALGRRLESWGQDSVAASLKIHGNFKPSPGVARGPSDSDANTTKKTNRTSGGHIEAKEVPYGAHAMASQSGVRRRLGKHARKHASMHAR